MLLLGSLGRVRGPERRGGVFMLDEVNPEIFDRMLRDALIQRLNRLDTEELLDLIGHLILRERFKSR
jgi:hypothetical protein